MTAWCIKGAMGQGSICRNLPALSRASLVAKLVKNPAAIRETWVQSPGWEDPLEKGKATYSSILSWRILWTEEPGQLGSMELKSTGHNRTTNSFTFHIQESLSSTPETNATLQINYTSIKKNF